MTILPQPQQQSNYLAQFLANQRPLIAPRSNSEAAVQLAAQLGQAYFLSKAANNEKQREQGVRDTLAQALSEQVVPSDPNAMGPVQPRAATTADMVRVLASNPDTATMGFDLKMKDIANNQALEQQMAAEDRAFNRQKALIGIKAASSGASIGGSTGALLDRLVKEDNGINSLQQALRELRGGAGATGRLQAEIDLGRSANFETTSGKNLSDLAYKPDIAGATAQASAEGAARGEATTALPQVEMNAGLVLDTIDELIDDQGDLKEGVSSVVGGFAGLQGRQADAIALTENQRRYQPFIDQIKGQSFLQAFERLKGGGVITEIEGQKATEAITRLNQAQDEADFAKSLQDLREVAIKGLSVAQQRAGQDPFQASQAAIMQREQEIGYNPNQIISDPKLMSDEELLRALQ